MLSLLPDLLDFSSVAPILLRLALGGTFFIYGLRELIKPKYRWAQIIGAWESVLGILLIIGLFTQIVALLIGLELLGFIFLRLKNKNQVPVPIDYLLVLLAIALALILLGPGLLAFDLPL